MTKPWEGTLERQSHVLLASCRWLNLGFLHVFGQCLDSPTVLSNTAKHSNSSPSGTSAVFENN
jgi:hypothetical protein